MKFSGKVWEWPLDDLITFLVNSEKPRDAAMHNTGTGFVVLSRHSLLISKLPCSSWPHVQSRSVAASDDTWQIEMKCVFPGPTSTRYCSFFVWRTLDVTYVPPWAMHKKKKLKLNKYLV